MPLARPVRSSFVGPSEFTPFRVYVIPAQAGNQLLENVWVPACAGMTVFSEPLLKWNVCSRCRHSNLSSFSGFLIQVQKNRGPLKTLQCGGQFSLVLVQFVALNYPRIDQRFRSI